MNKERLKDALESIAHKNVPDSTNLWPRIVSQLGERNSTMQILRARPVLLALVLFLLLAFLSGAAYAFGRMFGIVPGVGIVDQSMPLRVLSEPSIVERDGLTVTVSEMVADSKHTFVAYAWEGIIPVPGEGFLVCGALPSLQLPNGSRLEFLGGGAG